MVFIKEEKNLDNEVDNMEYSKKALNIKPSSTLAITAKAGELKASGLDVVGFGAGEPDFDTPEHIKKAAIDAINSGFTKYTPVPGIKPLREAIVEKLKKENGVEYDFSQIVVSNGAKHSLFNAFMAILNDGDEVIIPAPYWLSYSEIVAVSGGKPVICYTKEENNFILTRQDLEKAYTPKTKAIIFTSPSNPTGMVMEKKDLEMIADFAVEKDLFVISDEIYEYLIYNENKKHISIASLNDEIYKRTIVVNGMSKSYAMTGWRIGYTASNPQLAKLMSSFQSQTTSNANSIAQKAALAALTGPQDCVEKMRQEFQKRCDYIFEREEAIPGISALKPDGAFYLFVNVSELCGKKYDGSEIKSAADFAALLLEKKMVALVPCADFGMPNHVRLSYAISMETIKKGMDRIEEFVKELK